MIIDTKIHKLIAKTNSNLIEERNHFEIIVVPVKSPTFPIQAQRRQSQAKRAKREKETDEAKAKTKITM